MMNKKIEALGLLLGGYFHQDWPDEFDSDVTALQAIVESETIDQIRAGVAEIDSLLAETPSEIELRDILITKIGCYFDPEPQGTSYEQWLKTVRGYSLKSEADMQSFAIKASLNEYSEEEFMAVLNWFWNEDVSEVEENEFVDRFNELVEHPAKSDLIFFPETNREDSPLGVVNEIKRWYREQGKICFRE